MAQLVERSLLRLEPSHRQTFTFVEHLIAVKKYKNNEQSERSIFEKMTAMFRQSVRESLKKLCRTKRNWYWHLKEFFFLAFAKKVSLQFAFELIHCTRSVWPDWPIYWTLGNFKAFANNYFAQIFHILWQFLWRFQNPSFF